jgi:4-hydroxy-2-oxoheptanedioate aldolase
MQAPTNKLKARFRQDTPSFGCWLNLCAPAAAEIAAHAGFDWLLIDGEHGPYDVGVISDQLRVIQGLPTEAIVRIPSDETWIIKQVLDIGAQSIMVPMVNTAEQAKNIVKACMYPPKGIRGMGASVARAGQYGNLTDYITTANDEICIIAQVETQQALDNLDDMLAIPEIDGFFIGPADLSADLGFVDQAEHPEVLRIISETLAKIQAAGKTAGVMSLNDKITPTHIRSGARMLATASDALALNAALKTKAKAFSD